MGRIYSTKGIAVKPDYSEFRKNGGKSYSEYEKLENAYLEEIIAWAKKNGTGEYAGEQVNFPYADGYASYIVISLSPVKLIHIDIGDGWEYPYAHRLTTKDIKEEIDSAKQWAEAWENIKS